MLIIQTANRTYLRTYPATSWHPSQEGTRGSGRLNTTINISMIYNVMRQPSPLERGTPQAGGMSKRGVAIDRGVYKYEIDY